MASRVWCFDRDAPQSPLSSCSLGTSGCGSLTEQMSFYMVSVGLKNEPSVETGSSPKRQAQKQRGFTSKMLCWSERSRSAQIHQEERHMSPLMKAVSNFGHFKPTTSVNKNTECNIFVQKFIFLFLNTLNRKEKYGKLFQECESS